MAKKKLFNIHGLYPKDYCFDWDAFEKDPEHYEFTADDITYLNAVELEEYETKVPMTTQEKRALRRWVTSGHSVQEMPPTKYACIYPSHPQPDFLEVYRTDKELDAATKGMTQEQRIAYLKEYIGFVDETEEERQERQENEELHAKTPEKAKEKIRMLQRELCYTRLYLMEKGLYIEAEDYVKSHMEEPLPFEDEW